MSKESFDQITRRVSKEVPNKKIASGTIGKARIATLSEEEWLSYAPVFAAAKAELARRAEKRKTLWGRFQCDVLCNYD